MKNIKKERGAIAVMTAVMLTVLLMFTALSIDIGLHHYLGAKLQNAADSAATAVGQKIEANESNLNKCAYEYLAKNGYDNKGKYKDKIKADVDIKGVVDGSFYESTSESDEYLDYCLVKVTVDVDDSTLFANAMGISSLHLRKVAYVIVKPNYESMPEALRYSIFAGAEMGDKDTSSDDANAVISADNPAMDVQGSTGAGSGETAFSSVVAVAENAINGVNDFVQNFKGWMNNTFGTNFEQDYNTLVNINVSEAVINNDAHSNGNILIGVQALNAARSKDNDYTGNTPAGDSTSNYIQNNDDRYNALTDADDYGTVHFTAVDTIDFGYSRYAQRRAELANGKQSLGNTISWVLNNYLENQPEKTRVFVQNQQNVQVQQHIINILNEMNLDGFANQNDFINSQSETNPGFKKAAARYFKENNAVSTQIQNKVLAQDEYLTFEANPTRKITLNSQESIVYRVNQKVSAQYLDDYAAIEVDTNNIQDDRKSRLAILTAELTENGYDKMYKNNNSSNGFVYANYADKDGGSLGENQTENVVLERYELNGRSVPKGTKNATLKYTYNFKVEGKKVNRNTDNVEEYSSNFSLDNIKATRTGAKYAITRTFKEKSDYIDMPNLAPYFTRQINKSIRAATKKRGQFTDGTTKGSRNVQAAVKQAQDDLSGVMKDVTYTDNKYSDASKYDNEYARNTLFQDFKASKDSGLTTLTDEVKTLGGVQMSKTKFKSRGNGQYFELYNSEGKLKTATEFVNEYNDWNLGNSWFGHNKVNAVAESKTFLNGLEMNAVSVKENAIEAKYGDANSDSDSNDSYKKKKEEANGLITGATRHQIGDITGEGGAYSVSQKVLATPINPLATINDTNGIFFKSTQSQLFGSNPNTFKTELNNHQVGDSDKPNAVADSEVSIPGTNTIDSPYSDATISYPSAYTTAISSIPGTDAFSLPVENQDGWKWEAWVNGDKNNWELQNKKIYGINQKIKKSLYVKTNCTSFIFGYMDIDANGKSLDLGYEVNKNKGDGHDATLYVNGDIDIRSGQTGHIDFKPNCKLYTTGFIRVQSGSSDSQRQLKKGAYVQVGKFYRSGASLPIGEENATSEEKATMICSGEEKLDLTIDNVNYHCGYAISGSTTVYQNSALYVNGDMVNENDSGYLLLKSNSKVVVNGSLLERKGADSKGIYVESGAVLYVKDDITLWENKIENYGTIICGGTITSRKGDLVNKGHIIAKNISVGSGETRWIYNYGTIECSDDIYINGQLRNNLDWNQTEENGTKYDIPTVVKVGGNLTTVSKVINNPGTSTNNDAVIYVNGDMSVGSDIQNNYANNSSGARGFIYVGGRMSSTGVLKNYERSYVYSNGEIAPGSITNNANSRVMTNANINTPGDIKNSSGGFISGKTGLSAVKITNIGGIVYSGGELKATGAVSSTGLMRALGDFNFSSTVNMENSIFTCGGAVTGTGSISCVNLTARGGITANSLSFSGNIKTDGNVVISDNITIGANASFTVTNGKLEAGSITNNNSLIVNGNIKATGTLTNMKDLFCYGNITTTGSLINSTTSNRNAVLKCLGKITIGSNDNDACLENYGKMYVGGVTDSTNPSTVMITVNGHVLNDVDGNNRRRSIRNFGDILVAGSVKSRSVLYSYGGNIYVYGDIDTCNDGVTTDNGNNLLEIKGSTKIFVHGCITSSDSGPKRIWMYNESGNDADSSPNTVISIFGFGRGNNDGFGNKLEAFCNKQQGSNIYINSNFYLSGIGADNDSCMYNAGRLYVNGRIDCPNMKSAWLVGNYDYGRTLAQDYVEGTYVATGSSITPKYSGLTYCKGCFNAPNAIINVRDKHYVFVEDALTPNYNGTGTLNQNINVRQVNMVGESMFYAPNQADISGTISVTGTAIFNVQNKVNSGGGVIDGSNDQVVAPIEVKITDGQAANLSNAHNVVFNRNISTPSLTGTFVDIKIVGDLVVNGPINLTSSTLIVTGVIRCHSMTLTSSLVQCGDPTKSTGTLTIADGSTGGNLTMTQGSRMNVESNLVNVGAITENSAGLFVKGKISTGTSISLNNGSSLVTRNTEANTEGNHENDITLSGATTLSRSNLLVDGMLKTSSITVNGAVEGGDYTNSKLYAYTGIYFTGDTTINVDTTNRGDTNSEVFLGEANTRDDIYYDLEVAGSIYMPPGKNYGKDGKTFKIRAINNAVIVIDSEKDLNGNYKNQIYTNWIEVCNSNATLYCAPRVFFLKDGNNVGSFYTNYGKLYAVGGTDIENAYGGGKESVCDSHYQINGSWVGFMDGSETFVGKIYKNGTKQDTWTYKGFYEGHGDTFIDANLNVTNLNKNNKVGNCCTSMYIPNGTTYVSGNIDLHTNNALLVNQGCGVVCQNDLYMGCTIWNYGKVHIYGDFHLDNSAQWITDNQDRSKPYKGWSLKNGVDEAYGGHGASFIVYNHGEKGNMLTFKGYVANSGEIYMNHGLSVEGFLEKYWSGTDYAYRNFEGSHAHFAGVFRCNGNAFMNNVGARFGCDGRLTYGGIAINCGAMYVGGDLTNDEQDNETCRPDSKSYRQGRHDDCTSTSLMNGIRGINSSTTNDPNNNQWKDSTLFVGGNIRIGPNESSREGGSVFNFGTMYAGGYLKVYTSAGTNDTTDTGSSYYQTAIWAPDDSNTFIGGECYGGGAIATGKNSIFMCDGDLRARRPLKLNMNFVFENIGGLGGILNNHVLNYYEDNDNDHYKSAYMRVGGDVYANVEGMDLENGWFSSTGKKIPGDSSRDIDIQANSNIVIGGSFYCPQKLYIKQNANVIICGQGNGIYDSEGWLNWKCRGLDELSNKKNDHTAFGTPYNTYVSNFIKSLGAKLKKDQYTLLAYQLLDVNICSNLIVHGNTFVRDTCKIRDMAKTYIYGNFNAENYVEIGKSLSSDASDATEARLDAYKKPNENDIDYVFSNAGYMFVQGNFNSRKYTKIYASTTVKIGGNMEAGDLSQILGNPYITLRHDARVFVGGNMRAYSSIDCGAYSEMYVGGNVTAYTQNIKLRDQMTCYIGGNLAAATYIELGKYDDNFYRGIKSQRVQQYLTEAGDDAERQNEQGSVTDGGEYVYDGSEQERNDNKPPTEADNDNQTESEVTEDSNQQFIKTDSELENDDSDLAVGSEYYIGGNIISFTKYIHEYAYSRIVSGGYVVSPQHITLRHNADMWVIPEVFGKNTYHTTVFEYQDGWDSTLWSAFVTQLRRAAHDIKEDFEPKAGSIYSLGQLTMNTNTSIMGTYDTMVFGQTVMRKSSLIFMGHDFDCWAPSYNIQADTSSWSAFFDSMANNLGLGEKDANGEPKRTYKGFDSYDASQDPNTPKPIVIYANNEINVATTARISSTYFIANRGNVNFTNLNFASETSNENATRDAVSLPNGFASYQGDVNFYALRGALGALMYAPQGDVDLDGFAYDFYGSIVGDTVDINTFYINVHRFTNWRSMDLHVATSQKVYLVSEKKYKDMLKQLSAVDDSYIYGYEKNPDPNINEWAQPFFPGLKDDDEDDTSSSGGDSGSENLSGYDDGFETP